QFPIARMSDPREQTRHELRDIVRRVDQRAQFAVIELRECNFNRPQITFIAAKAHAQGRYLQRTSSAPYRRIGHGLCTPRDAAVRLDDGRPNDPAMRSKTNSVTQIRPGPP